MCDRQVRIEEPEPMAGFRLWHEVVSENVVVCRMQYARQSFRSQSNEDIMIIPMRGEDHYDECLDIAHRNGWRKPLTGYE